MTLRGLLRVFTCLEGASYLALVLIAMPLKYGLGLPIAVRIGGGVHGVLFVGFVMVLYQAQIEYRWPRRFVFALLAASLIPGSLLWLDRRIQRAA